MELTTVQKVAGSALPILFAITVHEVAHGWVADKCGDHTARYLGRLTLNPIKHIDLIGTVIVPLFMMLTSGFLFGWAKPVPVDFRNLKHPKRDMAFVAAAGPLSNLLMALFWCAMLKLGITMFMHNVPGAEALAFMGSVGVFINLVLGFLNLVPVPPLDGSRVVASLLPNEISRIYMSLERFGIFIVLGLLILGVLNKVVIPPVIFMENYLYQLFGIHAGVGIPSY